VIKHDSKHRFRFASLQSEIGKQLYSTYQLDTSAVDSIVLWENGEISIKSSAALKIAKQLNRPWPLVSGFLIIPSFIRNAVYDWIAGNRYQWFGKKQTCWVAAKELESLFL
jgi:predicted DCC family thiol-disulfide oxidoreductase YuxK